MRGTRHRLVEDRGHTRPLTAGRAIIHRRYPLRRSAGNHGGRFNWSVILSFPVDGPPRRRTWLEAPEHGRFVRSRWLLRAWRNGDEAALARLTPLVYDHLLARSVGSICARSVPRFAARRRRWCTTRSCAWSTHEPWTGRTAPTSGPWHRPPCGASSSTPRAPAPPSSAVKNFERVDVADPGAGPAARRQRGIGRRSSVRSTTRSRRSRATMRGGRASSSCDSSAA